MTLTTQQYQRLLNLFPEMFRINGHLVVLGSDFAIIHGDLSFRQTLKASL